MKKLIKKYKIPIIIFLGISISLILTYYLHMVDNNVIVSTFTTSSMMTFIGFSVALFIYANDTLAKLRVNAGCLTDDDKKREATIGKIANCYKELSQDLLFIFIAMLTMFCLDLFSDLPFLREMRIEILYGYLTKSSLLFFIRCLIAISTLVAICDIIIAMIRLNDIKEVSKEGTK